MLFMLSVSIEQTVRVHNLFAEIIPPQLAFSRGINRVRISNPPLSFREQNNSFRHKTTRIFYWNKR